MDIHFNGYKVRYNLLNYFLQPIRYSHHIKSINIFIDLDDLFHTLRKPLIDREFQACGTNAAKQLVSNVMNIAGHYRNWAMKEGILPKIYMIYTTNSKVFRNNTYIPEYRQNFIQKSSLSNGNAYFINTAIDGSRDIMKVICDYIDSVYLIDSKYLEPSIIPYYISYMEDKYDADWNIVISRDTYMLQYAYMDKFSMISPKGDNSTYINKANIWEYLNYKEKIYKSDEERLKQLLPQMFIPYKAIVGDRYRNIPRLRKIGWKTLLNFMIENNKPETSEELQTRNLLNFVNKKKIDSDEFERNSHCSNVYQQTVCMLESDKILIKDQLVDKSDYQALLELNGKLFDRYPLNLNFLCSRFIND